MKTPRIGTIVLSGLLLVTSAPLATADVDVINQELILLADDGEGGDEFGSAVAHMGSTVVVSALRDTDNGTHSGSAYLMNADTGAQIAKLLPSDGEQYDYFGFDAVAISGDVAIVGALLDNTEKGVDSGSVYVFDATNGQQLSQLVPDDGHTGDNFGCSVAMNGTTAIIGARGDDDNGMESGSVYLFDVVTGVQIAKLHPTDGTAGDKFGWSVDISGTTAIVGAFLDDENGTKSGSAYLFDTTTGAQIAKLLPSDGMPFDEFGRRVAISGDTAIVGAEKADNGGLNIGSAYLFDATTGAELAKLVPADGMDYDIFGRSVAINSTVAVIGAPGDDDQGDHSGSVYVYELASATLLAKLQTSYSNPGVCMGHSVSISETGSIIAGAWGDLTDVYPGAAFVFNLLSSPPGTPYCFGDGTGAACPCGNTGSPGEGCANSTGVGAKLAAVSTNSVSDGEFALWTYGLPAGPGLYFQGDNMTNSGNGVPFGDGLRCAGGNVIRIEIRLSTSGLSRTTVPIAITGEVSAGDTKHYQLWYRDVVGSPCGTGFNLSNGYAVLWMP